MLLAGPSPDVFALPANPGRRQLRLARCVSLSSMKTPLESNARGGQMADGWRPRSPSSRGTRILTLPAAIGFSYFEKLIDSADQGKVEGEVARIMSLNHKLSTVGGYTYFEDWADEMTGLLRELALNLETPDVAHALLLQRWNDASVEGGLIYYLRLLAATYLKANESTYNPFVPGGQDIVSYCSQVIELPNREIEHLGIAALVNVLLTPVDLVLEIAYLDRSPGSQVNHHRFTDDTGAKETSLASPTIYLLFRPEHYDILYRTPENDVLVQRLSSLSHNVRITGTSSSLGAFAALEFDALPMIPGLTGVSSMPPLPLPPTAASTIGGETFPPTQQSSWPPPFADDVGTPTAQPHSRQTSVAAPAQPRTPSGSLGPVPSSLLAGALAMDAPKRAPLVQTAGGASTVGYPIRFSPVQLDYDESKNAFRESTFQVKTNTFKNSVWNRAHYGNPDFHPEEWSPEEESVDGRAAGKKRGKKERDT